jgi:hypothetical protein
VRLARDAEQLGLGFRAERSGSGLGQNIWQALAAPLCAWLAAQDGLDQGLGNAAQQTVHLAGYAKDGLGQGFLQNAQRGSRHRSPLQLCTRMSLYKGLSESDGQDLGQFSPVQER